MAFLLLTRDMPAHELSTKQQGMGCLAYDPLLNPGYGYVPSLAVGIVFAVVFGLIMIAHIAQTSITRKWWYCTFALAALGTAINGTACDSPYSLCV